MVGKRQLALVALLGAKPAELEEYLRRVVDILEEELGPSFEPYELGRMHATLCDMAGGSTDPRENRALAELRGERRVMDVLGALAYLRHTWSSPLRFKFGGIGPRADVGFLSRGRPPFERSFSISGPACMVMGWPTDSVSGSRYELKLGSIRKGLERFGILHRYHGSPGDADEDFYMRVGSVSSVRSGQIEDAERAVRGFLADNPLAVDVTVSHIKLVSYADTGFRDIVTTPITDVRAAQDLVVSVVGDNDR